MSANCFHAHFTIQDGCVPCLDRLPAGTKTTIIDLEHGARAQRDVMLTRYYRGHLEQRDEVLQAVTADIAALAEATGSPVARTKLEYMGDFQCELTSRNYLEAHIKLMIPEGEFGPAREQLVILGEAQGFRLSTNPRERKDGIVRQFANLRIRHGAAEAGRARVREVIALLAGAGLRVESVHTELNVWDSNAERDAWWA